MVLILFLAGLEDDVVVVLQDYPSAEISKPIYRIGEKLRVVAQYELFFFFFAFFIKASQFSDPGAHLVDRSSQVTMRK